jgi:hypothetical protein
VPCNLVQVSFKTMESSCHITITQCHFMLFAQVKTISPYYSVQIHIPDIYRRFSKCLYSSPHCTSHLVRPLFSAPLHSSNRSAIFVHRATLLTWMLYLCASILTGNVTFTFLVVWLIGSGCELVGFCNVLSSKQLFQWLLEDIFVIHYL